MKQDADNDELLIQYLLGEFSDVEQQEVEQRYMSDPAFYEQLLAVEDDLIDAYVEGELSQSRRSRFEKHFLVSPDRRARVGIGKAWISYLSRENEMVRPVRKRPWAAFLRFETWPPALRVAAAVLVIMGGMLLIVETLRLRNRIEQAESQTAELERSQHELRQAMEEERRHSQELSAQLDREREERDRQTATQITTKETPSGIISLILTPGLVRGGGDVKRLIITAETRQVRVQVSFRQGEYESFSVVIRTVEGRAIWSKSGLKSQSKGPSKVVIFQAPPGVFATGDYILTLSGINGAAAEVISECFFTVSKM